MIALIARGKGVLLPVRAQPGARRSGIIGLYGDRLKVAVTPPPEKGQANKALVEVLSAALQIRPSQIDLVAGETSRDKQFLIQGVSAAVLQTRLQTLLGTQTS